MAVIWGIPYLLIKIAVAELTPATLVLGRTAIGAALLLPFALARGDIRPLFAHWKMVVFYTFVEVAGPWILLSDAERKLSSSLSGLLIAGVPLVGALLAWLVAGGERPNARRIGGLLIGFVGVGLVVGLDVATDDLVAVAEVGLVVLGYAIGSMLIARRLSGVPTVGVVAASLTLTAIIYAPLGIAQLPARPPSVPVVLSVVILGVICTALAFLVFFALVGEVGAIRATIVTYFNPAVALLLGVALLGERFTLGMALGFSLIVAGTVVATRHPVRISAAPGALVRGT